MRVLNDREKDCIVCPSFLISILMWLEITKQNEDNTAYLLDCAHPPTLLFLSTYSYCSRKQSEMFQSFILAFF